MLNRYLMQFTTEFRFFLYATALVVGLHAVLSSEQFDGLAVLWSYLTLGVAVIGTWRHSFLTGQAASAIALLLMSLFDPSTLLPNFIPMFLVGAVFSAGSLGVARMMRKAKTAPAQKQPDEAIVSVAASGNNADTSAAQVLARFGLNEQNAQ